jgi:hypothetical protein
MTNRKPDWSGWNKWCDARIEAKRSFDREVFIEVVAELKGMIEDQNEKLKVQGESIHNLETKMTQLRTLYDRLSAEGNRAGVKLAEHQVAIAELRLMVKAEQAKLVAVPEISSRHRGLN